MRYLLSTLVACKQTKKLASWLTILFPPGFYKIYSERHSGTISYYVSAFCYQTGQQRQGLIKTTLNSHMNTSCPKSDQIPMKSHQTARSVSFHNLFLQLLLLILIIYPLTARVIGAPQMISQPVFSIFPCSPLPSGTCRTPGLSIP